MSGEAAHILNAGEAMKPQPVNKLPTAAFRAFENIGTSSQGNCDSELIRAQQVSDASNWEGSGVAFLYKLAVVGHPKPTVSFCRGDES